MSVGRLPYRQTIALEHERRTIEPQLSQVDTADGKLATIEKYHPCSRVATAVVHTDPDPGAERPLRPPRDLHAHVDHGARSPESRQGHHVAATNFARAHIRQVQRDPTTGIAHVRVAIVGLHPPNPRRPTTRLHGDSLSLVQGAASQRSGDDRPDAGQGEDPVDRQARLSDVAGRRRLGQDASDCRFQLLDALPSYEGCGTIGARANTVPLSRCLTVSAAWPSVAMSDLVRATTARLTPK
jgi:hypothetical protein